jgi:hypothetical protein
MVWTEREEDMEIQAIGHGAILTAKWIGIVAGALVALLVVGFVVVPPLTRSFTDRWGATDAEVAETLPGDEWVRDPQQSATRAITINAPAALVNELVRQQGYKRAGWHGWDWFYNATGSGSFVDGHFSTRVVPELQGIGVGDKVFINAAVSYTVEIDDKPGVFALYSGGNASNPHLRAAQSAEATSASTSWAWVAKPLSPTQTRLILRIRGDMRGQGGFVAWLFDNPLDFGGALFANKTLNGIKTTAESLVTGR